jgi:hypothetical protein
MWPLNPAHFHRLFQYATVGYQMGDKTAQKITPSLPQKQTASIGDASNTHSIGSFAVVAAMWVLAALGHATADSTRPSFG